MKILNNLLKIFLIVFSFCGLVFIQKINIFISLLITICLSILVVIPNIIKKIFKYDMNQNQIFFYLLFIIVALEVGSIYNIYDYVWWFDLFTHFLSGIFMSYIATIILDCNKINIRKNKIFYISFIMIFSLAIAGLWEIAEFLTDTICGSNVQHSIDTGVKDTMEDIIIATIGSFFITIYNYLKLKNKV